MLDYDPNSLLPNLAMNLNQLEGKLFGKIKSRYKIYKFKKEIKKRIIKTSYTGKDIYDILVFFNNASKLSLLKGINTDTFEFDVFTTSNIFSVISGYMVRTIQCDDRTLKVRYKPVVNGNESNIEMQWTSIDADSSKNYSSTVKLLDSKHSIDDRLSTTKSLEFQSAKIMRNSINMCINIIIINLKERYLK